MDFKIWYILRVSKPVMLGPGNPQNACAQLAFCHRHWRKRSDCPELFGLCQSAKHFSLRPTKLCTPLHGDPWSWRFSILTSLLTALSGQIAVSQLTWCHLRTHSTLRDGSYMFLRYSFGGETCRKCLLRLLPPTKADLLNGILQQKACKRLYWIMSCRQLQPNHLDQSLYHVQGPIKDQFSKTIWKSNCSQVWPISGSFSFCLSARPPKSNTTPLFDKLVHIKCLKKKHERNLHWVPTCIIGQDDARLAGSLHWLQM